MTSDAQTSANRANSQHSTGPRSAEGKSASSRNALTHGLFTTRDFVQPGEENAFDEMAATYRAELNPQTLLEQTYVAAIISATWRLHRCSKVEAGMGGFFGLDLMEDRVGLPIQTSVDRARSQSFNILRRSTTELRRLQTDRALRQQLTPPAAEVVPESGEKDLVSPQQIVSSLTHAKRAKLLIFNPDTNPLASNCKEPASPPPAASETPARPSEREAA
jgi:hypothetical protein